MKLGELTIQQVHQGLKEQEFSCSDLVVNYLQRIKKRNNKINAFITVTEDLALEQAALVDKKIATGQDLNVLEGVPLAIKDNILIQGVKATGASKILQHYVAPYDATVISRLKEQGVVFLGKTNHDEFAMGGSGENSGFGATKNPHDLKRVPGGSSSGSAAAVADHQSVAALGSDTGGSVRQPASFCGVVGFKPTYGRVSRHGLMALASSFDQIGTIARKVADAKILFDVIKGQDKFDSTTVKIAKEKTPAKRALVIGVPRECFVEGMDEEVAQITREAIAILKEAGCKIKEISLPNTDFGLAVYYTLMTAEVSSNLARYDGVTKGHRADAENLMEMYLKTRAQGFGEEAKRRIMLGTFVLSAGYQDAYYKKAQKVRQLIKNDFVKAFKNVDAILTPTSPVPAFKLGEKFDDPLTMYLSDIFTVPANVAGLPGISVPAGMTKSKLPVGVQLMTNYFEEQTLFYLAGEIERLR